MGYLFSYVVRKVVACLDEVDETYDTYSAVTAEVYLPGPPVPYNDDSNGWKDKDMIVIDLQMDESSDVEFD